MEGIGDRDSEHTGSSSTGKEGWDEDQAGWGQDTPGCLTSRGGHSSCEGCHGESSRVGSGDCGTGPRGPACSVVVQG